MYQSSSNDRSTCIYPLRVSLTESVYANDSGNGRHVHVPDVQLRPIRVQYPDRGLPITFLGLHVPRQPDRRDSL